MRVPSRVSQLLLALVLAITASTGYSQIADDSGQNGGGLSLQPGSAHSFSGAVVNSITRQPILRALVQVGAHAAITGKDYSDRDPCERQLHEDSRSPTAVGKWGDVRRVDSARQYAR